MPGARGGVGLPRGPGRLCDDEGVIVDRAVYVDGERKECGDLSDELAGLRAHGSAGSFLWIGLKDPTHAEFDEVNDELQLHALAVEDAARGAVPAVHAGGIQKPAFAQRRRVGATARRLQDLAALPVAGPVFGRLELDRIAAEHRLAREAAEGEEGVVDVDEAEVLVLQGRRERRLPVDLQRFPDRRGQDEGRDGHSSAPAPIRARSCARLISAKWWSGAHFLR